MIDEYNEGKPKAMIAWSRQSDPEKWGDDWPVPYAEAKDAESARRIAMMVNMALERAELAERDAKRWRTFNEAAKKHYNPEQGCITFYLPWAGGGFKDFEQTIDEYKS